MLDRRLLLAGTTGSRGKLAASESLQCDCQMPLQKRILLSVGKLEPKQNRERPPPRAARTRERYATHRRIRGCTKSKSQKSETAPGESADRTICLPGPTIGKKSKRIGPQSLRPRSGQGNAESRPPFAEE